MEKVKRFFEKDLVLIGAGHTHCLFMKMWAMKQNPSVRVTLINPEPVASYTGMLPALIAGKILHTDAQVDLFVLCRAIEGRLILDNVEKIDSEENIIFCSSGRKITFDAVSINVGSTSNPGIDGFEKNGLPVRPFIKLEEKWRAFLRKSVAKKKEPNICLIGGGIASTELAFSMSIALKENGLSNAKIVIVEKEKALKDVSTFQRQYLKKKLLAENIKIKENSPIQRVLRNNVLLKDGTKIDCDFIVSCVGALPNPLIKKSDLPSLDGFVSIEKTLKIKTLLNAFATGDCAHFPSKSIRKSGVYAVRQAPILHRNILNYFDNKALKEFYPQRDALKLLVYKNNEAILLRNSLAFSGKIFWQLKKYIDSKFIEGFSKLREIGVKAHKNAIKENKEMLCGGCGSKVGSSNLDLALKNISNKKSKYVLSEVGDDAAILKFGSIYQTLTTDHLRSFTSDPWLLSKITAIHSLGDIWAMGSNPKIVLSTIIIPETSSKIQARILEDIINGANSVFQKEEVSIIGGHTSLGNELVVGFSIGGLSNRKPITVNSAKIGDQLVITKPLGSGVLLAGEMRSMANGKDIEYLFAEMSKSQGAIAKILRTYANAMTDITGFGLAGHLFNICKNSAVGAKINLEKVPIYQGAQELIERNIRSSIFDENKMYSQFMSFKNDCRAEILFDPQTAGPFLATVPQKKIHQVMLKTKELGCDLKVIGEITTGDPFIQVH